MLTMFIVGWILWSLAAPAWIWVLFTLAAVAKLFLTAVQLLKTIAD